jgi:hypothetical protein
MVCSLGFFVRFLSETVIIVLNESFGPTFFHKLYVAFMIAECSALNSVGVSYLPFYYLLFLAYFRLSDFFFFLGTVCVSLRIAFVFFCQYPLCFRAEAFIDGFSLVVVHIHQFWTGWCSLFVTSRIIRLP